MVTDHFTKSYLIVFAWLSIFGLSGCGGSSSSSAGNTGTAGNTNTTAPTTANGFPLAFDQSINYASEIYVSSTAGSGGDGSAAQPYDTITEALLNATPGTRINVAAGNYAPLGFFSNLQGTANAPIALVANGAVTIDGGGSEMAMHITDARYLIIDGFTIQNTLPHGINVDDGGDYASPTEYLVMRNMHFRNVGNGGNNDCLKLSGVDHFYIENSEFENCNQGEAIDMVGCHDGVITGNYFHDMPLNAMNTKGGSADILIHGNRFEDISQRAINAGGSTGDPFFRPINATYEGSDIRMIANVIIRPGSTPVAFVGCNACIFANNTVIEPQQYVARILEENTSRSAGGNGQYINNIIVFNDSQVGTFVNIGANTLPSTFTFDSNLWYAMDNPSFSGPYLGGSIPPETRSIVQQNPNLDTNYRITAGSPAAGQGQSVTGGLEGDYDRGDYNTPPSIGAFEMP